MVRFLFDARLGGPADDDDVIGCVSADERQCICIVCGATNCTHRGCLRNEVEEVA